MFFFPPDPQHLSLLYLKEKVSIGTNVDYDTVMIYWENNK